jgi:thiol-disulfide isomerase/thioredoxin
MDQHNASADLSSEAVPPAPGRSRTASGPLLLVFVAVLVLAAGQLWQSGPLSSPPLPPAFIEAPLATAVQDAAGRERMVLVVASASWCGPCARYARTGLADPRVTAWIEQHAVAVKVDVDAQPGDAAALGVTSLPTTILLRDGQHVARRAGLIDADTLLAWLAEHTD